MSNYLALQELNQNILNCIKCERFTDYRTSILNNKPSAYLNDIYWNKPVPGWGDPEARLLIVGLAPGAHGANRTGKVFVGDSSGDFLFQALSKSGFARHKESEIGKTNWLLNDVFLTNAVRCAPPGNLPNRKERENCVQYLQEEINRLKNLKVVLALGKIAFDQIVKALSVHHFISQFNTLNRPKFQHGAEYNYERLILVCSYHPSKRNTQTGLLTTQMFEDVFNMCRFYLENDLIY